MDSKLGRTATCADPREKCEHNANVTHARGVCVCVCVCVYVLVCVGVEARAGKKIVHTANLKSNPNLRANRNHATMDATINRIACPCIAK